MDLVLKNFLLNVNKKNIKTGKPLYKLAENITEEEWLRIQTTGGGCES